MTVVTVNTGSVPALQVTRAARKLVDAYRRCVPTGNDVFNEKLPRCAIYRLIAVVVLGMSLTTAATATMPVKIGLLFGFSGPIESMAPELAASAELALSEASLSGHFLGGRRIVPLRADSTCTDAAVAVAAAERLVTADGIDALIGADCSGVAVAVLRRVALPFGIVSISPTATSPALSEIDDDGLFFRTAPSDNRQGEVLAQVLHHQGITEVALTYTNNDYGKGLADAFAHAFNAIGGEVAMALAHTDNRGDYTAEVASLAASGASTLVVAGYADQGGRAIVRSAFDLDAFDRFVFPDGMVAESVAAEFGTELTGTIGTLPGEKNARTEAFESLLKKAGIRGKAPYRGEAYDAAALLALAMHAAGSTEGDAVSNALLDVANAPGEPIAAGDIARALQILSDGGDIDYVGATAVELSNSGEAAGTYREVRFTDNEFATVRVW